MGDLTIHGIDDDLKRRLEVRAARNGRSLDEDLREALARLVPERPVPETRSPEEAKAIYDRLVELGRPSLEKFDHKALTDELWDFVE